MLKDEEKDILLNLVNKKDESIYDDSSYQLPTDQKKKIDYANSTLKLPEPNQTNNKNAVNISAETNLETQPDSFLDFYKKYVPQPKESKETENSLRRLAIAELIQKGIAGVGNVAMSEFADKTKQWDSQPVSNTYLKSIEAAEQRRKYFDALNHDYQRGMFNVAVEDWKYKKGKEAKAAEDEERKADKIQRQKNFEAEMGLKSKEYERKVNADLAKATLARTPKQTAPYDITKDRNVKPINVNGTPWYYYEAQWNDVFNVAKKSPSNKEFIDIRLDRIDPVIAATMVDRAIGNAIEDGHVETVDKLRTLRIGGMGWQVPEATKKTETTTAPVQPQTEKTITPIKGTLTKSKSGLNIWTPPKN